LGCGGIFCKSVNIW